MKFVVTTGVLLMLALATATTAYAAGPSETTTTTQQQSDRWQGTGDTWKLKTQDGTGYLTNSWFQDLDGSWYMFGNDGTMFSGLITDQSTGKSYLLNTSHDGTYGRMLTVNGTYTINNKQIYLTFNQSHDGTYGAIQQGLLEVKSTGIRETHLSSIPTDSTGNTTTNTQSPKQNNTKPSWEGKSLDEMTDEEKDQMLEAKLGGKTLHPDNLDINAARDLAGVMKN